LEILAASIASGLVMPAIDARMNQIYCALYNVAAGFRPVQKFNPVVVRPDQIPFTLEEPVSGLGSGWDVYADAITSGIKCKTVQVMNDKYPQAKNLARVARSMGLGCTTGPCQLQASYVRNEIVQKP
jgi:tRNA A37 threonylcarbamoyladenosine modification protein TsaB